jgi:hypothetical protein
MKGASWLAVVLGLLVILMGFYGRFHGAWSIHVLGERFAASTFVLVGNSLLLIGIFLSVLALQGKK